MHALDCYFDKDASGYPLEAGDYVQNQWRKFGLVLSSTGGVGTVPRHFDTVNPGTQAKGDPDLGAPNEACPGGGSVRGDGEVPGAPGENCQGKV